MKKLTDLSLRILSFVKQYRYQIILSVILLFGLLIRVFKFWDNVMFAYDQGRDAHRIYDIITHRNLKIVGPETDIPGVFNGPLFYYLLLPFYFISGFNPNIPALFIVLVNLGEAILLYLFCKEIFNNKKVGLIAAFLWIISYEQANFAKYISNASFMSISSVLFFFGAALYIFKKKKWGLILSFIGWGLAIQFNFYLIYLGILYPIFYFIFKPKIYLKSLFIGFFSFFVLVSSFIVAELKWKFMGIKSIINYLILQSTHYSSGNNSLLRIKDNGIIFLDRMNGLFKYSAASAEAGYIILILLVIFTILFLIQNTEDRTKLKFLFIWFFSTLPLFIFRTGVITTQVINTTIFTPFTAIVSLVIFNFFELKKTRLVGLLLLILIFVSNLGLFVKDNFNNVSMFGSAPMLYRYEKQVMDYIYKTKDKNISICALTNPLFINTTWSFLFQTYGKTKYGYVPYWSGLEQYPNKNYLPYDKDHVALRYLIIEPLIGIPELSKKILIYKEDLVSNLIDERKIGEFIVQKRQLANDANYRNNLISKANFALLLKDVSKWGDFVDKEKQLREDLNIQSSQTLTNDEIYNINRTINLHEFRYTCFINYNN